MPTVAVTPIGGRMTGKKLKVAVLYDLWEEEPAEQQEEAPAPRKRKGQKKHKKKNGRLSKKSVKSPVLLTLTKSYRRL